MNTNLPENISAALIDMDGVLYDSMPSHAKAWRQMTSEVGLDVDEKEFFIFEGMTGAAVIDLLFRRDFGRRATEEEKKQLYARKSEIFASYGPKPPIKGADRMLRALEKAGITRVLVTGSGQLSLLDRLDSMYPGAFSHNLRVTAHDVTHGKPDPEPYLLGASKAGVPTSQAIVIENAPLGVRAGKAAGAFTIAVTTGPIPREAFEAEGADMIFPSMPDFADWLEQELPALTLCRRLDDAVGRLMAESVTVVTDSNVDRLVLPVLERSETLKKAVKVVIEPGEEHKDIKSLETVWNALEDARATRSGVVVNIGGGLVTDLGGFAAATFKRGLRTVNLPTTLLGAVDAASGGKTGINFRGLKNEIGAFHQPEEVIISSLPLASLPERELFSGYAEMIKTALIADAPLYRNLLDVEGVTADRERLENAMKRCVEIKNRIVAQDPTEKGLRKVLNFGHTAGHAFESLAISRGQHLPHGEAVAHGILVELILSHMLKGFDSAEMTRYAEAFLKPFYPRPGVKCEDVDRLIDFMAHDKKNAVAGQPDFTLLLSPGVPETGATPAVQDIRGALEIYLDIIGR